MTENSGNATAELSFGQKAVGLTFNPGGSGDVHQIKTHYASLIDMLQGFKDATDNPERKRQLSVAITEAQTSQMWAVKAVTWQY